MTDLAPIRSTNNPTIGADTAVPMAPTSRERARAPRPQFISSAIGFKKIGKVLRTVPQHTNRTKKQAAMM
jgi:hypothetical protein